MRFLQPLEHLPADAQARLLRLDVVHLEEALGVVVAVLVAQLEAAFGDQADAAPLAVAHLEDVLDQPPRRRVALDPHGPGVLVFHLRPALLELANRAQHALQQVERLEACDDDGHPVAVGDGPVLGGAHDGADVARPEEGLHAVARRLKDGGDHRRHQDVRDEHAEVGQLPLAGQPDGHGVGRGGRLEADGEEDHLAVGPGGRQADGVEGRVDDADVAAVRLELEQVAARARHAEHVAEGAEGDVRPRGDGVSAVDHLQRGDAHGASRPVDQFHLRRQQAVDAVLDNGVRLAAADLHDGPRPGNGARNGGRQRHGRLGVPVLVQVFHGEGSCNSSSCFISARNSKTRRASASSMRDRAKPTWTRT